MASAAVAAAAAVTDLCAAITAIELFSFLDPQSGAGTTTSAQAFASDGAAQVLLPLAAAGALFTAVAFIYRHLLRHAAGAGAGNRRPSGLLTFVVCAAVGVLEFFLFVQPAGGRRDVGALGLAAVSVLPAAATATFFLGMTLVIIAHIRDDGEGGGGANAGEDLIQAPVRLVTKIALGAAAALVSLMVVALYGAEY